MLAEHGCTLALSDVNEDGLSETARALEASGVRVSTRRVDVADREAVEAWASEVEREHGAAHMIFNNAGVAVMASLRRVDYDDFHWLMNINFWGVVHGTRAFLPILAQQDEAHIVNISSLFGLIGLPTQSSYAASKFAVRGFSESLRSELQPLRIGVTSVHPGGINTNIVKSSRFTELAPGQKAKIIRSFEKRGWPPELVGKRIIDAIERDRARVLVGPETYVTDLAKRLIPTGTNRIVDRLRKRLGL